MPPGLVLRVAVVAILVLLLAAVLVALAMPRRRGEVRATALGHVEELRRRLLRPIAVLVGATVLALTFRIDSLQGWPVPRPALFDNVAAQVFGALSRHLVPPGVQLVVLSPLDGFVAQFGIACALGAVVAAPVLLHQLGRFVGPALRPGERRLLAWSVLPAMVLFVAGAAFAYGFVLPATLAALYQFSDALGAATLLQVSELTSFALAFLLGFGLAFQLPLAMVVLSRVGLVHPRAYWRRWRHAVLLLLAIAMVVTPDPTIFSQVMLAAPLILLYLLGAAVATRVHPKGEGDEGHPTARGRSGLP